MPFASARSPRTPLLPGRPPALGAALALLLLAAACEAPSARGGGSEVEVRLSDLLLDPETQSPVVVLEEKDGLRKLPIWIGTSEAISIAAARDHQRPIRPNTHDLAKRLVDRLDAAVERIVVTRLSEGVYYALIHLRAQAGHLEVDARPSDAIAIALRYQAPLFVHETLLVDDAPAPGGRRALPEGHPPVDEAARPAAERI